MAVVAITGKLSSGKTTVLKLLKRKGAHIFNADEKVHQLYRNEKSSVYKKIAVFFPDAIQGQAISRKKLGAIVFSDTDKRRRLERIIHPVIIKELKRWLVSANKKKVLSVAEVPLLFEKGLQRHFDYTALVTAPEHILIERIRAKYHVSRHTARKRLRLTLPVRQKRKMADFIIDNSFTMNQLQKEVDLLWKKLKQKQR